MNDELSTTQHASLLLERLREQIGKAMVGQHEVVQQVLVALLASGHALIEGVPGLGKTLLVRALSQALALRFARIQFTPDLMPSDITGHAVLDPASRELRIVQGPVFTNLLLADEVNRAPAKTQSALLELMQEYQVTLEGRAMALPRPFMVLATQNPVETEGTYPLPEAQLDRFLLKIEIGYPSLEDEIAIVARATQNQSGDELPLSEVRPCLDEHGVALLQALTARQRIEPAVTDYAVRLARATRGWPGLALGCGSRGVIALVRAARAHALLEGRDHVLPDDVKRMALPVLRHRVAVAPEAMVEGRDAAQLLGSLVDATQAPRA